MAEQPQSPAPRPSSPKTRETRDIVRLVLLVVGLVLLVAFIVGNSASVKVNFVFFSHSSSLIWVIIISVLLGVVIDRLVIALAKRRRSKK
jgi:uncharacterized integral membrane protein